MLTAVIVLIGSVMYAAYCAGNMFNGAYSSVAIPLGNGQTVYLKHIDSGAIGPFRTWISARAAKCVFPDSAHEYQTDGGLMTLNYRIVDGMLVVLGSPWSAPTSASTVPIRFLDPETSQNVEHIYQEPAAALYESPVLTVQVPSPAECKAFPFGITDGSWHDWADPWMKR